MHVPYMHEQVLERLDAPPSLSIDMITDAVRIAVTTSAAAFAEAGRDLSVVG